MEVTDELDLECRIPGLPTMYPELEAENLPSHQVKHCTSCCSPNLRDANWCIECGVSLLEASKPTKLSADSNPTHIPSNAYVPSGAYVPSCISSGIASNVYNVIDDKPSNKPTSLTQQTLATTPTSHWETSSSYFWRRRNKTTPKRCSLEPEVSSWHDIPSSSHYNKGLSLSRPQAKQKSQSCSKVCPFINSYRPAYCISK